MVLELHPLSSKQTEALLKDICIQKGLDTSQIIRKEVNIFT